MMKFLATVRCRWMTSTQKCTTGFSNPSPDKPCCTYLSEPLRIVVGTVEVVACLVKLELSFGRGRRSFSEQGRNLAFAHRLEAARGVDGLLQNLRRFASGDYNACRKVHRVVKAFGCSRSLASQDEAISHRLHAEHPDVVLHQHRQNFLFEAVEVSVH